MSLLIKNEDCASCSWFVPICTLTSEVLNLHCILQMPTSKHLQNTECLPISSCSICLSGTFFLCWTIAILPEKGFESSPQPTAVPNPALPTSSLTAWLRHGGGPLQPLWLQTESTHHYKPDTGQKNIKFKILLCFVLLPHNAKVPAQRWKII